MTEKQVRDAVRAWIASIMGITVIHSYQGGPEPAEPYGVLNLMMSDALYPHQIEDEFPFEMVPDPDNPGEEIEQVRQAPVRDWFWKFSVNVYGADGATILRKISTARLVAQAVAPLLPLSLYEVSQIRDATEILNEEWQSRAQMDIEIRGLVRDGIAIDVADTAAAVVLTTA